MIGDQCSVDGCDRTLNGHDARGLCTKHYQRVMKHGDPTVVGKGGCSMPGRQNPNWAGDDVTYYGAHLRVRRQRGSASAQPCTDCSNAARHWSYDNTDPDELTSKEGRYSTDPARYVARCVPCHSRFDRAARVEAVA